MSFQFTSLFGRCWIDGLNEGRYEDLRVAEIPEMMALLSFLKLRQEDMPSLTDLACMVEPDHSHEACVVLLLFFFITFPFPLLILILDGQVRRSD